MSIMNLAVGIVYLLQTIIGVLGNFSLLYHYLFLYFTGYRLKPTDLIVNNLTVANSLVLFSSGILFAITHFGWYHHLGDFGCKFFPYLRAVSRGVSVGTTCLLSVFQAITISPMNSRWADLKRKAPRYVVPTIFLYWILQMLVKVIYAIFMFRNFGNENITNTKSFGYCSSVRHGKIMDSLYAVLIAFPDVVCFVLMLWASSSMVFILYRHKQRVQHIHRTLVTFQTSPESRATKTVLVLVSTFLFFNTLSSIFHIILSIIKNPNQFVVNTNSVFSLSFPIISPFLFLSRDSAVSRLSFACIRNIKSTNPMRNM